MNVTKRSYYRSHAEWFLSDSQSAPKVVHGKWQPYGVTREIVLKQIVSSVDNSLGACPHWRKEIENVGKRDVLSVFYKMRILCGKFLNGQLGVF